MKRSRDSRRSYSDNFATSDKNPLVDIDGDKLNLKQLSRNYKVKYRTLQERYRNGDRGEYLIRRNKLPTITYVPIDDHVYTLSELAHQYGFITPTVKYRFQHGSRGKALITPFNSNDIIHLNDKKYTFEDLAKMYDLSINIIKHRYRQGKRGDELVAPSRQRHNRVVHHIHGKDYTFKGLSRAYDLSLNTLYDRYYHYRLRNEDLINPKLFDSHFMINGKEYNLIQLRRRYRIPMKDFIDRLKAEYRQGVRGDALIRPFENQHGSITFHGKRYTGKELASKYHLPYSTILNRLYHYHLRGNDLVRPKSSNQLRQLSLGELDNNHAKEDNDHQGRADIDTFSDDTVTKAKSSHDSSNDHSEDAVQGTVTKKPTYNRINSDLQILTFPLFTMDDISSDKNDSSGRIVDCVAFNDTAKQLWRKIHDDHVYLALSGKVHDHERSKNDKVEMIVDKSNIIDDEDMFK